MRVTKEGPGEVTWQDLYQRFGKERHRFRPCETAHERGEGEMRQGQALTRQKKLYHSAPACMAGVQKGSASAASNDLWER